MPVCRTPPHRSHETGRHSTGRARSPLPVRARGCGAEGARRPRRLPAGRGVDGRLARCAPPRRPGPPAGVARGGRGEPAQRGRPSGGSPRRRGLRAAGRGRGRGRRARARGRRHPVQRGAGRRRVLAPPRAPAVRRAHAASCPRLRSHPAGDGRQPPRGAGLTTWPTRTRVSPPAARRCHHGRGTGSRPTVRPSRPPRRVSRRPPRRRSSAAELDDARSRADRGDHGTCRTSARPISTCANAASPEWPPSWPGLSPSAARARCAAASTTLPRPRRRPASAAPTRTPPASTTSRPTSSARPCRSSVTTLATRLESVLRAQPGTPGHPLAHDASAQPHPRRPRAAGGERDASRLGAELADLEKERTGCAHRARARPGCPWRSAPGNGRRPPSATDVSRPSATPCSPTTPASPRSLACSRLIDAPRPSSRRPAPPWSPSTARPTS